MSHLAYTDFRGVPADSPLAVPAAEVAAAGGAEARVRRGRMHMDVTDNGTAMSEVIGKREEVGQRQVGYIWARGGERTG